MAWKLFTCLGPRLHYGPSWSHALEILVGKLSPIPFLCSKHCSPRKEAKSAKLLWQKGKLLVKKGVGGGGKIMIKMEGKERQRRWGWGLKRENYSHLNSPDAFVVSL